MTANTAENIPEDNAAAQQAPDEVEQAAQQLEARAEQAVELAEVFEIDSDEMYEAAGHELVAIKKRMNEVEAERKRLKAPILEAAKRVDGLFKTPLDRFRKAESIYKRSMQTYHDAKERERREAQRAAEAEQRRLEAEAREKHQAELERAKAEASEREREALEKAEELAQAGKPEEADRLLEEYEIEARHVAATIPPEPAPTVPTVHVPETPKASGVSYRDNWKAEVTDLDALLQAIVEGKAPKSLVKIDSAKLNQLAKAMKDELRYPGVRAYNDRVVAAGGR